MTIREHRGEMEQKIIKLEGTLEKSELELKESNKQVIIFKFHNLNCLKINTVSVYTIHKMFLLFVIIIVLPRLALNSNAQGSHKCHWT